jgi:predicted esterase
MPRLLSLPLLFLLLLAVLPRLSANSDERAWILADGKTFRAELVRYDEKTGRVSLRFNDTTDRDYTFADFGVIDQAWLAEWIELEDDLNALVRELGGKLEHLVTTGEQPTDLFVYTPSSALASSTPPPPALILFHPGGKAARYVKSHMEAAEKSGLLLVACGQFRNTRDEAESDRMLARFKEAFPQILARVRLDPARLFLGGTSGGASRAYHYTAQVSHPWAGVYANVGWLNGRDYYGLPYPSGMRVAMVNGSQDLAANQWVQPDGAVLEKAGNAVGVFAFEGGHQVPPPLHQFLVFEWLLGREPDARSKP